MVEEVASVADAGVRDHDVDASESLDCELEEREQALPGGSVAVRIDGAGDGLCRWLDIADQDMCAGFGEVVRDALADAAGAAGDEGEFAAELVACVDVVNGKE